MEAQTQYDENSDDAITVSSSWSSATNWAIADGSLEIVTFESYDSPIDSDNLIPKPPLILKPPSPDSGPCEIKINFTQKHEIRQVYVRSTARVYEIYFEPSVQTNNEYLCTVRCSIAAQEEELLYASQIEECVQSRLNGSTTAERTEEKLNSESSIGSNEDGWVEVKVSESPLLGHQNYTLPNKSSSSTKSFESEQILQDFYEATAEITDADPSISLTLRLLSVQSQGCVYVHEVYVFGYPVEPAEPSNQELQLGTSAGNSLMAMLVPTLLQLSRPGFGQKQDHFDTDERATQKYEKIGLNATNSTATENEIQHCKEYCMHEQKDVKLEGGNEAKSEPHRLQIQEESFGGEKRDDSVQTDKVERVLEQLVSRVSNIEQLFLRFEENMLKPIHSMEARLQHVEQKLEVMAKSSLYSRFSCCTKISAPSFSCIDSNASSFYNDRSGCPCGADEFEKQEIPADEVSSPTDDKFTASTCQCLPSLVVTAPEFTCADDSEVVDVLESLEYCHHETPKKPLSIDDALADALAGFVSTSLEPSKDNEALLIEVSESESEKNGNDELTTKTLSIRAPEFACEEYNDHIKIAWPIIEDEKPTVRPIFHEIMRSECLSDSVSILKNTSYAESKGESWSKPKQALSIDDAWTAALAGFLSTSPEPSKNTRTLSIKVSESANEETGNDTPASLSQSFSIRAPKFMGDECGDDDDVESASNRVDEHTLHPTSSISTFLVSSAGGVRELQDKPKKASSIDDDLASVLAGFASTSYGPLIDIETLLDMYPKTAIDEICNDQHSTYAQTPRIVFPALTAEGYDKNENFGSPSKPDEKASGHPNTPGTIKDECSSDSVSTPSYAASAECFGELKKNPKQALSIDDALATIFAGFVSPTPSVSSLEFDCEEIGDDASLMPALKSTTWTSELMGEGLHTDGKIASLGNENENPRVHPGFCEIFRNECSNGSVSTSNKIEDAMVTFSDDRHEGKSE